MFRFTIRDLLWLTIVAALAIGWWLDSRRSQRQIKHLEQAQRTLRFMDSPLSMP